MALNDNNSTIIIKKIKKGGHGHHGGAWKVAYADFVTAMMAFFLLMWLINVSTDKQKEGIAEYFMPTFGVKGEVGNEKEGGSSAVKKADKDEEKSPPGILIGQVPQGPVSAKPEQLTQIEGDQDAQNFQKAQQNIKQAFEEDPNFRDFKDNIIVEQNPEGLKIQIHDSDKYPMFEANSLTLSQFGEQILGKMSEIIKKMPNRISITGHTDATNYANKDNYTNWELSADRANVARRYLLKTNMELTRVYKVVGMADQDLLDGEKPESPRNRRISIILLRNSYLKQSEERANAPRGLLTVPKPTDTIKAPVVPAAREIKPSAAVRAPMPVDTPAVTPMPPSPQTADEPIGRLTPTNSGKTGISAVPSGAIDSKAIEGATPP